MRDKKVSVVLATYNEREHIGDLIENLCGQLAGRPLEIIVVDDDSPDRTADFVEALHNPAVVLIRRSARGLAAAFNRGIIESTGEIICWMDADMTMPVPVLVRMIEALESNDVVVGSRYAEGGSDERSRLRVGASRSINWLARTVLGGNIMDYDSGFVALRREVLNTITIIPFGYGEYFIEMLYDAHRSGLRIAEVGYAFRERSAGTSKSFPSLWSFFVTGLHYVFRIFSLRFRFLRGGS